MRIVCVYWLKVWQLNYNAWNMQYKTQTHLVGSFTQSYWRWGTISSFCFRLCTAFNPLNAELNPICHLLALLGAHHILHVSRIRVKERTVYERRSKERMNFYPWTSSVHFHRNRHSSSAFYSVADSPLADCLLCVIYLFTSIVWEKTW